MIIGLFGVGVFCLVRAIFDLRAKRYAWGGCGLLCAAAVLFMPVPTHSVVIATNPAAPAK